MLSPTLAETEDSFCKSGEEEIVLCSVGGEPVPQHRAQHHLQGAFELLTLQF